MKLLFALALLLSVNAFAQGQVSTEEVLAKQQCAENAAQKKDPKKFEECVKQKLAKLKTETAAACPPIAPGKCQDEDGLVVEKDKEGCPVCKEIPLPYITKKGTVLAPPQTIQGPIRVKGCKVTIVSVKYLGNDPICWQEADDCDLTVPYQGQQITHMEFNCSTSSVEEGCSKTSWQKCASDETYADITHPLQCFTDQPGPIPATCKQKNRPAKSHKSETKQGIN